MLVLKDWSWR